MLASDHVEQSEALTFCCIGLFDIQFDIGIPVSSKT